MGEDVEFAEPLRLSRSDIAATERRHAGQITGLRVVGNRLFSSGTDGRLLCLEGLPEGPLLFSQEHDARAPIADMSMPASPDLQRIVVAAACRDSDLRLWDLPNGPGQPEAQLSLLKGHTAPLQSVDSRGEMLLSASEDKTAKLWDIEAKMEVGTFQHKHPVQRALFLQGNVITVTIAEDHVARMWDLRGGGKHISEIRDAGNPFCLAADPDGRLACSPGAGKVNLYNFPRTLNGRVGELLLPSSVACLRFALNGRYLGCGGEDGDIYTVRLSDFTAQSFDVQHSREPQGSQKNAPVSRMWETDIEGKGPGLLYAFGKQGWGFALVDEAN